MELFWLRVDPFKNFDLVYHDGQWVSKRWYKVKVGDFVQVQDKEYFPADLLFLSSR